MSTRTEAAIIGLATAVLVLLILLPVAFVLGSRFGAWGQRQLTAQREAEAAATQPAGRDPHDWTGQTFIPEPHHHR